ncbi:MAG: transglycosylase SLT domain-containing protein [Bacteroidia bacterium]|nr:transglycosylase SLT domain-containing protein [Bacteroidia bacterium]
MNRPAYPYPDAGTRRYIIQAPQPAFTVTPRLRKWAVWLIASLLGISIYYRLAPASPRPEPAAQTQGELYLIEKANLNIKDVDRFEQKVREVARSLDIPPEWLMAVMYSESQLNPSVVNHKGSGATGLIQFMAPVVRELNDRLGTRYYMSDIQRMSAHHQMNLVQEYLHLIQERYGSFESLTDLYLAILYPRAVGQGRCYTLYAAPSLHYRQNAGLDENEDGQVTVSDIDNRMQRLFPTAYFIPKSDAKSPTLLDRAMRPIRRMMDPC